MGADLYLRPVFNENREQWESLFYQAVERRDKAPEGSHERKQAQEEVVRYYDRMYERGYFRDPYNNWSLLWKFGLSWWDDIIPLLDEDDCLSVEQVRNVEEMLTEREDIFEQNLVELSKSDQRSFRGRYRALRKFLKEALERNLPIDCSL